MPKFLAINYVSEAVQRQRIILERMLVHVPHIVNNITDATAGNNILYQKPWTNTERLHFEENRTQSISAEWQAIQNLKGHDLEEYSENNFLCSSFGKFDIVPSSNPESQISLDDIISNFVETNTSSVECETFEKVTFDQLSKSLEEPAAVHQLSDFLANIPTVEKLLKRLKPKLLKDPFVGKDGSTITEDNIFRNDKELTFITKPVDENDNCMVFEETFEKEIIHLEEKGLLEEEFQIISDNYEISSQIPVNDMKETIFNSNEKYLCNTQEEIDDIDLKVKDVGEFMHINVTKESALLLVDNVLLNKDEIDNKKGQILFSELNNQKTPEINTIRDVENLMLETPNTLSVKLFIEIDDQPWRNELPLPISDISMDSLKYESELLITKQRKKALLNQVWTTEKHFDDILALCLQVPCITDHSKIESKPEMLIQKLHLKEEQCSAALELDLPWDPIQFISCASVSIEAFQSDKDLEQDYLTSEEEFVKQLFTDCESEDKLTKPTIGCDLNITSCGSDSERRNQKIVNVWTLPTVLSTCSGVEETSIKSVCVQEKKQGTFGLTSQRKEANTLKKLDPIDDFMLLRGKLIGNQKENIPLRKLGNNSNNKQERTIDKDAASPKRTVDQVRDCKQLNYTPVINNKSNDNITESITTPKSPGGSKKRSKCNILQISLSDPFDDLAHLLEECAQPHLTLLKIAGRIPSTQLFAAFTPDVTRYILKQHEKSQHDGVKQDVKTYQAVVGLHVVTSTFDYLLHCSLKTAIIHLNTLQEKYSSTLEGSLNKIREELLNAHNTHQKNHILHPKISQLCYALSNWYVRKQLKSPEHDIKILVTVKSYSQSLLETLSAYINEIQGISSHPQIKSGKFQSHDVINSLDQCNCLVIHSDQIGEDFPWAQFSLVIEYQHTPTSKVMESCNRQSIRYIGIHLHPWTSKKQFQQDSVSQGEPRNLPQKTYEEFTMIGSQNLIKYTQVLQHLESRYNIQIVERDYSSIFPSITDADKTISYADIIVDERTGIIMQPLNGLDDLNKLSLISRIKRLEKQFEVCWVILMSSTNNKRNGNYPFAGMTMANLFDIHMEVASPMNDFQVKVFYSCNDNDTAELIRQLCEMARQSSVVWNQNEWVDRAWLTPDISLHEKLLLAIPCLNSFSVQMLLTLEPLSSLMSMSKEKLQTTCPWLPAKVLQEFYDFIHYSSDILQYTDTGNVDCSIHMSDSLRNEVHIKTSSELEEVFDYSPDFNRQSSSYQNTESGSQTEKPNQFDMATIENQMMNKICGTAEIAETKSDYLWDNQNYRDQFREYSRDTESSLNEVVRPTTSNNTLQGGKSDDYFTIISDSNGMQFNNCSSGQLDFTSCGSSFTRAYTDRSSISTNAPDGIVTGNSENQHQVNKQIESTWDNNTWTINNAEVKKKPCGSDWFDEKGRILTLKEDRSNNDLSYLPVPKGQKCPYENENLYSNPYLKSKKLWHEFGMNRKRRSEVVGFSNRESDIGHFDKAEKHLKPEQSDFINMQEKRFKGITNQEQNNFRTQMFRQNQYNQSEEISTNLCPLSQDARSRTPGIAPVTPSIRSAHSAGTRCASAYQHQNVGNNTNIWGENTNIPGASKQGESPPMDYDSDDDYDMSVFMQPQTSFAHSTPRIDIEPANVRAKTTIQKMSNLSEPRSNSKIITARTPKEKKLTYEKIPGGKSGQTRLNFK